jgi:hypothetical protein
MNTQDDQIYLQSFFQLRQKRHLFSCYLIFDVTLDVVYVLNISTYHCAIFINDFLLYKISYKDEDFLHMHHMHRHWGIGFKLDTTPTD